MMLSIHSFASIAQIAQLSLVFFIAILCYKSIKMLGIKEFLWVSLAFISNLSYIAFTILSDVKSPLYPIIDIDTTHFKKIALGLNLLTSFFFLFSFTLWFTKKERLKRFKRARGRFVGKILHFVLGTRVRAILELILVTGFVIIITIHSHFERSNLLMNWTSTLYSLGGIVFVYLLFRWNSGTKAAIKIITIGYFLWGTLQFLVVMQNTIEESLILAIGFSFSLIAKLFILGGIFLWCVDFTGKSERLTSQKEEERIQFEKSLIYFKDILQKTFHELNIPLKFLRVSLDRLSSSNLPRELRGNFDEIENGYERIKAIITVAKNSYTHEDLFEDELEENFYALSSSQERRYVSINLLIEMAVKSIKTSYKGIEFRLTYGGECYIECKNSEIIQVFVNIIKNAIEAYKNEEPKIVSIKTQISKEKIHPQHSKKITIEIENYAEAIDSGNIEKIWTKGFSTKYIDENNIVRGQGLYIVKDILSTYNNTEIFVESPIQINSDKIPIGTKFTIIFPKGDPKNK